MNLLVDTHTAIWFITGDEQLTANTKRLIQDINNACFISIASFWEIGIKHSLGKLDLMVDLRRIFELIEESGLLMLPITTTHILTNASLDFHHRDPFDRLIISQAMSDNLTLVSKDQVFKNYNVSLFWE